MSESHEDAINRPLWPEDTVEYRLFPTKERHELTTLAVECTHYARALLRGHLWHYGEFALKEWKDCESAYPAHLYGRTCFRDNIEDEWLIVHLLFALSKHYTDLVISVADGDGEFLLIEAAHALPRWLKPETATNRVYIYSGQLHIIPKPNTPADVTRLPVATPTIRDAIRIVADPLIHTTASECVQTSIQSRLNRFSESLDFLYHHTHCCLPLPAAHVISHDPQLVSAAVHALCDRDPADTSAVRRMGDSVFSPTKHPSLLVPVRFTKLLYAKLVHEQYSAPRKSGFTLPPSGSPEHRSCDLGMKLTCGLEMLMGRVKGALREAGEAGVDGDPRWKTFVASLTEKGYFRGELEGSKGHQQLMASAREYFRQSAKTEAVEDNMEVSISTSAGHRVAHIVQNIPYSEEELKTKWGSLQPPDDDSWLELQPEDLEAMLKQSAGYLPKASQRSSGEMPVRGDGHQTEGSKVAESEELDLESLVFGMKSFVDKVSSHKGAEFPWTVDESTAVNFDPDSFLSTVQTMLEGGNARQPSPDNDSEGTLSGDDLSISSEEDVPGESGEENEAGGESVAGEAGEGPTITQLMAGMDLELAQTELGKSFEKVEGSRGHSEEQLQPVNIDFNLVKNLLDSYTSQGGGAGPASNILSSLGVQIPEQSHDS